MRSKEIELKIREANINDYISIQYNKNNGVETLN